MCIRDRAADAEPPRRLRKQKRQHAQRLGKAALDGAVGDAEDRAEQRERGIRGADDAGGGELLDSEFLHDKVPPFFV